MSSPWLSSSLYIDHCLNTMWIEPSPKKERRHVNCSVWASSTLCSILIIVKGPLTHVIIYLLYAFIYFFLTHVIYYTISWGAPNNNHHHVIIMIMMMIIIMHLVSTHRLLSNELIGRSQTSCTGIFCTVNTWKVQFLQYIEIWYIYIIYEHTTTHFTEKDDFDLFSHFNSIFV